MPLCGNSIGMDRRFLAAYLPEIEEYLHYRSVDVSTSRSWSSAGTRALNSGRPRKAGAHRALDDILREHRRAEVLPRARVRAAEPLSRAGRAGVGIAYGEFARIQLSALVGGTRFSPMSSSNERKRASSFDALMPYLSGLESADRGTGATGPRMHGGEVLAGDGSGREPAQGFAPATFRSDAGAQGMGLAEGRDRAAALVAGSPTRCHR